MICFEMYVNGKRVARAGIPGFAVLSSILTWVNRRRDSRDSELTLSLGGLDSNGPPWEQGTHVRWAVPEVTVGDRVEVKIVEADDVDPPAHQYPTYTKAKLDRMRNKSARHYLALYRRQRQQLDRQIADLEREVKKGEKKATRPKRTNRE